jgi:hypothetical protein
VQIELLRRSVEASFVYTQLGFLCVCVCVGAPPPIGCVGHPIWNGKRNSVIVLGILSFLSGPGIFSCRKVFLSCHRDLSGGFAVQLFCIIVLSTSM